MTVAVDVAELDLATDGVTKAFNLSGPNGSMALMSPSDLLVWFVDADSVATALTYAVDYTITGSYRTGGGVLTTNAVDAYADGGTLAVRRNTPRTQPEAWADNDGFAASVMQNAQDRGRLIDQDGAMRAERTLSGPLFEGPIDPIPSESIRGGKVLSFDPITKQPTVQDPMVDRAETAAADAEASAASAGADLWPRPIDKVSNDPDDVPEIGMRRLVGPAPTGAWVGRANQIAEYFVDGWHFSGVAKDGQPIWDELAKCIRRYSEAAGAWVKSANKAAFLSWFVAVTGAYDYAAADTFSVATGVVIKGDVDIDVSDIAEDGVTFAGTYKPAHGIITRGSKTLTFADFIPARYQAFDTDGTGLITMGGVDEFHARMFGIRGDGSNELVTWSNMFAAAAASNSTINGGKITSRTEGTLIVTAGMQLNRVYLDHYPPDDTYDCITVNGGDYSPNYDPVRIDDCRFRGLQAGWTFGRDLVRINRGDHIQGKNTYLVTPKQDGVHVAPDAAFHWVENLTLENWKVSAPGRDGYRFELVDDFNNIFINQVSLLQCECRGAKGAPFSLINNNTKAAANKLSNYTILNFEAGAATAVTIPIAVIQGPLSGATPGSVENIDIRDSAVEDPSASRTGFGVSISGRCTGEFTFRSSIEFGASGGQITGFKNFPDYDIVMGTMRLRSHMGIAEKYRTAQLLQNATENADWILNVADTLLVFAKDRFATGGWRGCWVVSGTGHIDALYSANVTLAIVTDGSDKKIQITNTSATAVQIEIAILRPWAGTSN